MDKLNLKLYVEQVNCNTDSAVPVSWEENEEIALNKVVDPNTEFMPRIDVENKNPVSPIESYSLTTLPQHVDTTGIKECSEQTINKNLIALQIEEAVFGGLESGLKIVPNDGKTIPKVHGYISSYRESLVHNMEQEKKYEENKNKAKDFQSKLLKYPSERITVVSEKRSYLNAPEISKITDDLSPTLKEKKMQTTYVEEPSLTASTESVATLAEDSKSQFRNSMFSSGSLNSLNSIGHDQSTAITNCTTTDQLLWAFRLARDRLDSASNISGCSSHFELDSNCSEKIETISTISDVSGYEEEMYRIRRLLLSDSPTSSLDLKYPKFIENNCKQNMKSMSLINIPSSTEKIDNQSSLENSELLTIQKLNIQLQNALAEKIKYKVQLAEIESKLSLEWEEKYYDILRQKAHTEGRLEVVQAELEAVSCDRQAETESRTKNVTDKRVFLQEIEKLTLDRNNFQQLARELEQQKQEQILQLELKSSEIIHSKQEIQELESSNEKLRIELQELRVELESKDGAIQGLKEKVADQHVEFQLLYQAKLKAESSLTSCKNEMESIRNSGNWYRDQLHICQTAKLKIQQELMTSQANVVSHTHLVEKLKSKNASLSQTMKDIQQRAVKEKELLMRKLEVIQADMLEREAAILSQIQREEVTNETITSITAKLRKIEENKEHHVCVDDVLVKELEEQRDALSSELQTKDASIKNIETENYNLMMRITTLQKILNEKELLLQSLDNKYRYLEMAHNQTSDFLKCKEQNLLDLKNEKVAIEVTLAAAEKERIEIDLAINKLREDFGRISNGYHSMKSEIRDKNKQIENMEKELQDRIHETEVLQTEINELLNEKEGFKSWQSRISNTEKMEKEVEYLMNKNSELQSKLSNLMEVQTRHQKTIAKLEEQLAVREQQLMNQTKNFEVFTEEQSTRDKKLMDENKNLTEVNEELKSKISQTEANNAVLLKQIESYKRQISCADETINQFNKLCRGSELEKYNLDKQLRKALKDLEGAQEKSDVQISNSKEDASLFDKGVQVQIDQESLLMIQDLIENSMTKAIFLASNCKKSSLNMKDERTDSFYGKVSVITSVSEKLTDLAKYLDKAIEEQRFYMLEKKHPSKDKLEFKVVRTREETNKRIMRDDKSANGNMVKLLNKEPLEEQAEGLFENTSFSKDQEKLDFYQKEIEKLKSLLRMTEIEHREKYRRYENNVRTLLKKVKEHMQGRKMAERALQGLQSKVGFDDLTDSECLQLEVKKLNTELEASRRQCEEQKRISEKSQSALIELEKERGKLAQTHDVLKEQRALSLNHGGQETSTAHQLDHQARELQFQQLQRRVVELEEEAANHNKLIRDLKKKVFIEKCENSQLKKQLSSLRIGLDAANEMLDNKNIEVGRNETWRQLLSRKHSDIQKMLELEQLAHEECRDELVKVKAELEETRAKDPVLADQIKTLSYHLHQKTQEAAGLQEKFLLAEERWSSLERNLHQNISVLQEEVATLHLELESLSRNKLVLQTQAAELRAALHSSLERNKMLKLKLEAFSCDNSSEKLPDLTSSLPLPPSKYDEAQIAELLHQSAVLPDNKPLSNLQSCLDSLKQEMATLQMQLTANTIVPDKIECHKLESYCIQNV